jgi:hypothetical protein
MKLLTENKKVRISEGLDWHITNKTPLYENVYRFGSKNYFKLINEVRKLYNSNLIEIENGLDKWIMSNTDIGKVGIYNGRPVMLDIPVRITEDKDLELQHLKLFNKILKQIPGSPKQRELRKQLNVIRKQLGYVPIGEAKYGDEDVELNKPSRNSGSGKKYKVYVKNDNGNVVKVTFGDVKGGLTAKINNPEARKAFADRHNCSEKKDKTKPGYWACNMPRYWKFLGGDKNMNTYW